MKARTEQGFPKANWSSSREAKKCWCLHQDFAVDSPTLKSRNDYGHVRHDVRFGIDSGQQQGCGERFGVVRPVIR